MHENRGAARLESCASRSKPAMFNAGRHLRLRSRSAAAMPWRQTAMSWIVRSVLALAALVLGPSTLASAAEQVDLLLALASDVSRSVDHPKFLLQREGY